MISQYCIDIDNSVKKSCSSSLDTFCFLRSPILGGHSRLIPCLLTTRRGGGFTETNCAFSFFSKVLHFGCLPSSLINITRTQQLHHHSFVSLDEQHIYNGTTSRQIFFLSLTSSKKNMIPLNSLTSLYFKN